MDEKAGGELRECPFCGKVADLSDRDTLYPTGIYWREEGGMRSYVSHTNSRKGDGLCWGMHCPQPAGGCGVEVLGDSKEEAMAKWNRRSLPVGMSEGEIGSIESYETDERACAAGIERFAAAMQAKLNAKRKAGRGGWNKPQECGVESLYQLLEEHERKGDHIDIANFCMMIWNRENPNG